MAARSAAWHRANTRHESRLERSVKRSNRHTEDAMPREKHTKHPSARISTERRVDEDALWYKDAIIYEVHVRAFYDSNGDGVGDFCGLTEKLDYVADLGVTAIWVLPF